MQKNVLGSSGLHNQDDQNKVRPEYKFYVQLIFQYLYEVNLYADLLFRQLPRPAQELILKHRVLQDVEVQN